MCLLVPLRGISFSQFFAFRWHFEEPSPQRSLRSSSLWIIGRGGGAQAQAIQFNLEIVPADIEYGGGNVLAHLDLQAGDHSADGGGSISANIHQWASTAPSSSRLRMIRPCATKWSSWAVPELILSRRYPRAPRSPARSRALAAGLLVRGFCRTSCTPTPPIPRPAHMCAHKQAAGRHPPCAVYETFTGAQPA